MKTTNLKPLLASLVVMLASLSLSAHDVEIDGIYYYLYESKSEAHVTYRGSYYYSYNNEYSGDVTIPSTITTNGVTYNVTHIGEQAFYGCSGLTSVTIPESVTIIGGSAFSGCSGLTSVTIPEGVTNIGSSVFSGCTGLTEPVYNKKIFAYLPTSFQGDYTIPSGIETITGGAFRDCTGLTSVTIPENVTSIGSYVFSGCSGLTEPVYNKKIFAYLPTSFQGDYTIPSGIETIAGGAFSGCSGLTSITIPSSVTSIGSQAFFDCSGLTSITIPEGVTSIGSSAFFHCSGLTSITIPKGLTSIGKGAFSGCSGLTSVTILEGVTSIGDNAFYDCTSLTSITIPSSVTSIGEYAFDHCRSLTKAEFASIEHLCGIEFGSFNSNPLYYANHLFVSGKEVTEVVIPSNVTSIGHNTFERCLGLTVVTIPESVTSIGDKAFSGCTGIKTVNALSATPPALAESVFSVYSTAFLYVPLGCEEAYGTATGWSSFTHLREKDFGTKDCLLTLKGFNGGSVALKCKTRSTYAFQIHAEEGWKVSSMTFNGADATASIAADGSYTTPSLTDDSELCVVFEEEGSAVGAISTEDVLRVSASGEVLSIQNEGEAMQATIFTTDGKQVKAIEAKRGTTQVRLAEGQIYLVKIGGRTFKVAM